MSQRATYRIDWNGQPRQISVPRDNLVAEIGMSDLPPLPNPTQAILDALEQPIGCAPLSEQVRPGNTVAILTGDRFTDHILGRRDHLGMALLDHLNRLGVRDEDVTLVYAPGSHPSPHWREILGAKLMGRVRCIRHDCHDEASLAYLGVTSRCTPVWINRTVAEADFRLGIGEISPNLQGGWCGGGKIILPGVAGWDTIQQNHAGVLSDINTLGLADGNPMRLDMEEAAAMAHLDFKVDVLVDRRSRVVAVYAGAFVAEHRAALAQVRRIWMTPMAPADIYVLYPGQGAERHLEPCFFMNIEAAEVGTVPDGIIIMVLSAAGGWAANTPSGHPLWMAPDETADLFRQGTEALARVLVRKSHNIRTCSMLYSARRVLDRRRVLLVCDGIAHDEARALGFAHCTPDYAEALALALAERGADARIAVRIIDNTIYPEAGRPVSWRAMPWREG